MPWDKSHKRYKNLFSRFTAYAPLTLPTLAGLIPKESDIIVHACDEMVEDGEKYLNNKYDVVMMSFITCSSNRAYELSKSFREKGSYIVFGGYHTTFMPDEAKEYADTIIIGEGEISIPKFINDFRNNRAEKVYHYPNIQESDRKRPDRSVLKKHKYSNVPTILANKGCPNNCEFCAISKMANRVPRCIADVIDEMKSLKKRKFIFFDPNFLGNKKYAMELMKEMIPMKIKWIGCATINTAFDDELLDMAKASGCIGLLVGIESLNSVSLESVNKGFVDPNKCKEAIGRIQQRGISVNGCFILGFDSDTEEDLLSLPKQAEYLNLNLVMYYILTPRPNSKLYNSLESEDRILTKDWSNYTQNKTVFKPKNMSQERLDQLHDFCWNESYKLKNIIRRAINLENDTIYQKILLLLINIGFKFVEKGR